MVVLEKFYEDESLGSNSQELHQQWRSAPKRVRLLVRPVQRLGHKVQIEVPYELGEDQTHFRIGQATKYDVSTEPGKEV